MPSRSMMEDSPRQPKFPLRRSVTEFGLLGCFTCPMVRVHKREVAGSSSSSSSKDEFFSDDDPDVELFTTDSSSDVDMKKLFIKRCGKSRVDHKLTPLSDQAAAPIMNTNTEATEESFVFSPPALADSVAESPSFRTLSDPLLSTFSYDCASGAKTLARISVSKTAGNQSFGGRPQPLPPLVLSSKVAPSSTKPVWLPLPEPQDDQCENGSSLSTSELRFNSGGSLLVSTSSSQPSSFTSMVRSEIGSWSARRAKKSSTRGLPLPPPSVATKLLPGLESYEFKELIDATQNFAPGSCMEKGEFGAVHRASMKDRATELSIKEMAVVRLAVNDSQSLKDWKADVQLLAQLPDTNICLVKGYCSHEDVKLDNAKTVERLLVFEQSPNGNLHDYLCGTRSKIQLDWSARISIVLGAARGLLYLHDRAPVQVLYREFNSSSILLDKDYTPRLAGYGLTVTSLPADKKFQFSTVMKISQTHAKSNVRSFGVVLLELLTGKYSRDSLFMCDEKNFVQWAAPFLKDESKLLLILDPRIKGNCPMKGALKLAEIALRCLKRKEAQRPTMSRVVDILKTIKDNYYNLDYSFKGQEKRRATFGGISFNDLQHRSQVVGQYLSMECASSISDSSGEDDSKTSTYVSSSQICTLQTRKTLS